ncbi:hypothetical protein BGW80DRAFT_278137 [Lactifluus volemus]|nr:hypothetical protein BGW80DRAFT_278137 [Lactifluus volemus]
MRRLVACVNFADAVRLPDVASPILEDVDHWDLHSALQHVDMGQFLKGQGHRGREKVGLCAQSIIVCILSNVQGRDERWVAFAADQLGESKDVIQSYLERGIENMLLAILTHVTGQIVDSLKHNRKMATSTASILQPLSNFDVQHTLPEVQNSFLTLWNKIEHHAPEDRVLTDIRNDLFNLYNALPVVRGSQLSDPSPGSILKWSDVPRLLSHRIPLLVEAAALLLLHGPYFHCNCNNTQHC